MTPPNMRSSIFATAAVGLAVASMLGQTGCGGPGRNLPGTRITGDKINRSIRDTVEGYRVAVERGDAEALYLMASDRYIEDGGTSFGTDDYTHDGLKDVLTGRFRMVRDIRYAVRYMNIERSCPGADGEPEAGCMARVEVLIDASFTVVDARGQDRRVDKRDQNELVLEWTGDKWQFISGM